MKYISLFYFDVSHFPLILFLVFFDYFLFFNYNLSLYLLINAFRLSLIIYNLLLISFYIYYFCLIFDFSLKIRT